ncbi:MAG: hypothetical protein Q4G69_07535 [Planctomycetia bacterium]|nr:hypothetical protein [Planctomycetia bacterium]
MKIFIAGIMQGSIQEKSIHSQNYRKEIADKLRTKFPDAEIYDPFGNHQNSLNYTDQTGKETFLKHNRMCGTDVDLLIAYIPEASMGTAVEMWEAWKNNAKVISITPMIANWAVRFLSHAVYPDLSSFLKGVDGWSLQDGQLILPPTENVFGDQFQNFE